MHQKNYEQKYIKYKLKYLQLKHIQHNNVQHGGFAPAGLYEWKDKMIKSTRTLEDKYFSFYEKSPIYLQDKDKTTELKPDKTKVLVVDSIDTFDAFTNKYCSLIYTDDDAILYVKWDKVARDFMGFYLIRSPDLKLARYSNAMFKGKRCISWWKHEYSLINVMIFSE